MTIRSKHLLVIRFSAMGDVAMLVPVLSAVVRQNPSLRITVVTRDFFAPIFEDLQGVEVFPVKLKEEHKGFLGIARLARELMALRPDGVADLHNVIRSKILCVFLAFRGINSRTIDKGRGEKAALTSLNLRKKIFKPLSSTFDRYRAVFSALGFRSDLRQVTPLPRKRLGANIVAATGYKKGQWLGIAPFAQHQSKTYPKDLMEEVLARLDRMPDIKIFLFGGGATEVKDLARWEGEFPVVTSVAERLSFSEQLDLISNLDAMLSMDSGNGHLAANYGIPVIVVWGNTHPYAGFAPFNQSPDQFLLPDRKVYPLLPTSIYGKPVPKGYEEVMRTISPDRVIKKVEEILGTPRDQTSS